MKRHYLLLLLSVISSSGWAKITTQAQLTEFTQNTEVWFSVTDNLLPAPARFKGQITIINHSEHTLPAGQTDWALNFHLIRKIEPSEHAGVKIEHLQGDLHRLRPSDSFAGLARGQTLVIPFESAPWMISYSDFMPRAFMVIASLTPEIFHNTDTEDFAQFVNPLHEQRQLLRNIEQGDHIATMTNAGRFDLHQAAAIPLPALTTDTTHRIIPRVNSFDRQDGQSILDAHWHIVAMEQTLAEAQYLQQQIQQLFNITLPLHTEVQAKTTAATLSLKVDTKLNQAERYQLHIQPNTISIVGNDPAGVFYGIQSLLALLSDTHSKPNQELTLPLAFIDDAPRYSWRGMHYDMARNFHGMAVTKRLIAQMGRYKLNKLHLHLTEDEGWRIEIPGLPELTEIGAVRCFDLTEQQCLLTQLGTGPHKSGSGNGFYQRAEFIELLKYAKAHHIDVIPEIDLPGHARAAIKAMEVRYQRYNMAEQPEEALRYRLTENFDQSRYLTVQNYTDNAINVCLDSTYAFIDKIIAELQLMYQEAGLTLNLFHMGGDEVAKGAWENAPACKHLINTQPELTKIADLKPYFINRVAQLANKRGLALAAWEDGLMADAQTPFPRQQFNNKQVLVNAWDNIWEWGYGDRAYVFANAGYQVVQSAGTNLYFDHPQEAHPEERGYYWATRYNDTERVFFYRPDHLYHNAEFKRDGSPITDLAALLGRPLPALEKPENMLGIQGQVWSETIRTAEQLEQMIYPRLLALAERAWHKGSWEPEKNSDAARADWQSFASRLGEVELYRLQASGSAHYLPPVGAKLVDGEWQLSTAWPNLIAEYSLDQGHTWQLYQAPVSSKNTGIIARSRLGNLTSRAITVAHSASR